MTNHEQQPTPQPNPSPPDPSHNSIDSSGATNSCCSDDYSLAQGEPKTAQTAVPHPSTSPNQPADSIPISTPSACQQDAASPVQTSPAIVDVSPSSSLIQTLFAYKKPLIIGLALLIGVAVVYAIYSSMATDLSGKVKPSFEGYNTKGTISWNEKEFLAEVHNIVYKKYPANSPENVRKSEMILDDLTYGFDKTSQLSNDDQITFTITSHIDGSPIKSVKKTFTVSGLKEIDIVSNDDILNQAKVSLKGISGAGALTCDYKILIPPKDDQPLKNGDVIPLQINDDYINQLLKDGKAPESDHIDYTVTGLVSPHDITNKDRLFETLKAKCDEAFPDHKQDLFTDQLNEKTLVTMLYGRDKDHNTKVGALYKIVQTDSGASAGNSRTRYLLFTCDNLKTSGNEFILADNNYYQTYIEAQDDTSATRLVESKGYTVFP